MKNIEKKCLQGLKRQEIACKHEMCKKISLHFEKEMSAEVHKLRKKKEKFAEENFP